jgi:hypothetical protein
MSVGGGNTADLCVCVYRRCVMTPTHCVASLKACYFRVAGFLETQWYIAGRQH